MIHKILQYIVWLFIKMLISTYRVELRDTRYREQAELMHPKGAFIFAMWHEQVLGIMLAHAWTKPYLALASRSKDGDYAAFVATKLGFKAVRGSSRKRGKDKGGKEAIQEYVENLHAGISGGLTVDGPKGPRRVCKSGAVIMAKETGAAIMPVSARYTSYWEFNSWDKFKVPKPFSKIIVTCGEPIRITEGMGPEIVTQALNSLEERCRQTEIIH